MRIQSKSTKLIHFIDSKEWDKMGYRKHHYTVVDTSDSVVPSIKIEEIKFEKIEKPEEEKVEEFIEEEVKKPTPREVFEQDSLQDGIDQLCDDNTKAQLIEMLNENGIKHNNEKKEILAELYIKWTRKNY